MLISSESASHPFPKRAIHFDFHTMPGVPDVGSQFDEVAFSEALCEARVEYITVFARCNLGFTYYPTEIGVVHPGLQTDLLGKIVKSCQARNIQVAAYFNVRLSHEEAIQHPEWLHVNKNGQIFDPEAIQNNSHFFRELCINTGYGKHLQSMIREVIDRYPVDGIFLDCMGSKPCRCSACAEGMTREGLNPLDEIEARGYAIQCTKKFQQEVEDIVDASPRALRLFLNGIAIPYREQPGHIEIETLPAGGWGYEALAWQLRYARTLKKPLLAMTGRFQEGWGDFGGLLPEHSLLYDCFLATSLGASCSIGDHLHPRGYWEPAVQKQITNIFQRLEALDPWTTQVKPLAEILILEPSLAFYPQSYFDSEPLVGARRILSELHYQFDISDGSTDFSKYKVIFLPDHTVLNEDTRNRLKKFLASGGKIISSATAGLQDGKFILSNEKFRFAGDEIYDPAYFVVNHDFAPDVPAMPMSIYHPGIILEADADVETLAKIHKPYFNKGSWTGQHLNLYTPPDQSENRPALIKSEDICHFSFPVFKGYFHHASVVYRQLVQQCLALWLPDPLLTSTLPPFVHIAMTQQPTRRMIHLLAYIPEMRGAKLIAQDPIPVSEGKLTVRLDGQTVHQVFTAPDKHPVSYHVQDDSLYIHTPSFNGYALFVIE